jgi:hypothetical protein
MKSIEQVSGFAITLYSDYCNRGLSPDIAREQAMKEVLECNEGVLLVQYADDRR